MPCSFELDPAKTFPGTTLFTKGGARCIRPTAVYLPAGHAAGSVKLNVLLWVHGWYVQDLKSLLKADRSKLRETVRDSGKDVVLVAPFLGHKWRDKDKVVHGHLDTRDLAGAKGGERYLDEGLDGLARHLDADQPPALEVASLVLACHSGGGAGMHNLRGTLGRHRAGLKACWGLDCLYGADASPDNATFWHDTLLSKDAVPLAFHYGPSTLPQSVKLDLMARGRADARGNEAQPPTHMPLQALQVVIGQPVPGGVDALMFPAAQPAKRAPRAAKPVAGAFVAQAATNLAAKVKFDKDIHCMIARDALLERLKGSSFL